MTARVVSIDREADGSVVHLDNGQLWKQMESPATRVDLAAGDEVTLDRSLGSYWLSGRNGPVFQVREKRQSSTEP